MCTTTILPAAILPEAADDNLLKLTYTFNRWLRLLANYGKLDSSTLNDDFVLIGRVIKDPNVERQLKNKLKSCRDYVLSSSTSLQGLQSVLIDILTSLRQALVPTEIIKIEKYRADQGMTEKFRPLTKRLAKEKIRKIGRKYIYTDWHTDDKDTTKLIRRIVEKRAAQNVHKNFRRGDRQTARYRQAVRRATSYSLYTKRYAEYDQQLRAAGTHWKVSQRYHSGQKILVAKYSYSTYEEALAAAERWMRKHPEDPRPMSAYKCEYCGKWHIGHEHVSLMEPVDPMEIQEDLIAS